MAITSYKKPQSPISVNKGTTGIYPLTTMDQVIIDENTGERLTSVLNTIIKTFEDLELKINELENKL